MKLDEARYASNAKDQVRKWSNYLRTVREYLYQNRYFEVTTSSLVETGAFESTIDPIRALDLELHTSPEMEMKRLISTSHTDIFQITKCFRDDPDTEIHGKEFTMLEFYKINAVYGKIIEQTKELFSLVSGRPIVFKEITIQSLFQETLNIDLGQNSTRETLTDIVTKRNILQVDKSDSWEDIFFKLMIEKIEPSFKFNTAYVVKDYPASTSVLSKKIPGSIFSERFEIYWQNKELCNGCTETGDLDVLRKNFDSENVKRLSNNKTPHPKPENFFSAMKQFPACSGVAIGLDRLFTCIQ